MKKLAALGSLLVLILGAFFLWQRSPVEDPLVHSKFPVKPITSKELLRNKFDQKRERRKAGSKRLDNPDQYALLHRSLRTRSGQIAPEYPVGNRSRELSKAMALRSARQSRLSESHIFVERGPGNIAGRTRSVLVLPGDQTNNSWLAGTVGGGIWKTTDAGQSWIDMVPDLPNLATTSLAMCESNPEIIYAGTGESFAGDGIAGDGIFKSNDGGDTWTSLASSREYTSINRIIVDPNDPDILLAATESGLYDRNSENLIIRSTDGGQTWMVVYNSLLPVQQLIATPGDFGTQYATVRSVGVLKSTDGGLSWSESSEGITLQGGARTELAISNSNPSLLFASAEGELTSLDGNIYVSDDAAVSWTLVGNTTSNADTTISLLGGQGNYDNTIAAHPYYDSIVYVGGVNLFKVTFSAGNFETEPLVKKVDTINTATFMDFINFGASYFAGQLEIGEDPNTNITSVEVRFGPNLSQKGHRFSIPAGTGTDQDRGAGVADEEYAYEDYVDVPFQAWDVSSNPEKQLMVSFRDQQGDGTWNLIEENTTGNGDSHSREYVFIHSQEYAEAPLDSIAKDGGQVFLQQYFFWPVLADGGQFTSSNLPDSKISIDWGTLIARNGMIRPISDAYLEFGGPNNFTDQEFINQTGIHPDHHALVMIPDSETEKTFRILNSNDGGVYVTKSETDPGASDGDWVFSGKGLNTTQFYGVDKKTGFDVYIGGMQDNSTWLSPSREEASESTVYEFAIGGDGIETIWHNTRTNEIIASIIYNDFRKSTDGGDSWISSTNGLTDRDADTAPFLSQLANSPSKPDLIYAVGESGVWHSNDFGDQWSLTPIDWELGFRHDIEVSLSDNSIVWSGAGMDEDNDIFVSTDNGQSFSAAKDFTEVEMGVSTGLASHPTQDSTAYALFSFARAPKILRTMDLGQTWEDISGFGTGTSSTNGFPDVAVYSLLVLPNNPEVLWAGTEIGIFESIDNGANWVIVDGNLPATAIWQMKVVDDQVVIATHGRGIWTTTLQNVPPLIISPIIDRLGVSVNGEFKVEASFLSPYDSSRFFVNGELLETLGATEINDIIFSLSSDQEDSVTIQIIAFQDGKEYSSPPRTEFYFQVNPATQVYQNDLDSGKTDFFGDFSIAQPGGFSNKAIHSPHPYEDERTYIHRLRTPIIVAEENAIFQYDDVAIVETGEAGTSFGDEEFWDYVIVEYSRDGIIWNHFKDGYDASLRPNWEAAYDNETNGTEGLYFTHEIDLKSKLASGDTVFLRFRLFSDQASTSWGWAVDNIKIQVEEVVTALEEDLESPFQVVAYPNPVADQAQLQLNLSQASNVTLRVVDQVGRVVEARELGYMNSGETIVEWETNRLQAGMYIVSVTTEYDVVTTRVLVNR